MTNEKTDFETMTFCSSNQCVCLCDERIHPSLVFFRMIPQLNVRPKAPCSIGRDLVYGTDIAIILNSN
jgi:hypothetical protein